MTRYLLLLSCIGSALLIASAIGVIAFAPELVRSPIVVRLGERLNWSGGWVTTTKGCFFRPDIDAWENSTRIVGYSLGVIGTSSGIVCIWRLARKASPEMRTAPPGPEV
jgi:hypothetical protein